MRKNRLIALIGTLTMAAAGLAAVSAGVSSKKAESVNAANTITVFINNKDSGCSASSLKHYLHCWGGTAGDKDYSGTFAPSVEGGTGNTFIKFEVDSSHTDFLYAGAHGSSIWDDDWAKSQNMSASGWSNGSVFEYYSWENASSVSYKLYYTDVKSNDNTMGSAKLVEKGQTSAISVPTYLNSTIQHTVSGTANTGYQFKDISYSGGTWSSNPNDFYPWQNQTLTVNFEAIPASTYSVVYYSNNGDSLTVTDTVEVGQSTVALPKPSEFANPERKRFNGWALTNSATTADYAVGDPISSRQKDEVLNLYAVYDNAFYIRNFTKGSNSELTWNATSSQFEGSIELEKDDLFEVVEYSDKTTIANYYYNIQSSAADSAANSTHGPQISTGAGDYGHDLKAEVAGTYNVYMKDSTDSYKIYIPYNHFSVIYHANGGTVGSVVDGQEDIVSCGKTEIVRAANTYGAPSGQLFRGWNTAQDGSGDTYQPSSTISLGKNESLDLYAMWSNKIPQDGYYVIGEFAGTSVTRFPMTKVDGKDEYTVTSPALVADNYFKFAEYKDEAVVNWYGADQDKRTGDVDSALVVGQLEEDEEHNYKVVVPGSYTAYLEPGATGNKIWISAIKYNVTYNYNVSGASVDPVVDEINVGTNTKARSNPFTKPAHATFAGWATSADGEVVYEVDDNITNRTQGSNLQLYAVWNYADQVTVTYHNEDSSVLITNTGYAGDAIDNIPEVPAKTGYSGSWNPNLSVFPASSTDVNPVYSAIEYNVTLDPQSGSGGSTSVKATYDAAMPQITVPTKTGYTFGGYYSATGASGTKYYNSDGTSAHSYDIAGTTTLYASWSATSYSITYRTNGGTLDGTQDISYNIESSEINLPSESSFTEKPEGCDFGGWYESSTFEGSPVTSIPTGSTGNKEFFAKWIGNVTITFKADGQTIGTISGHAGDSIDSSDIPAVPSKTGYHNGHWESTPTVIPASDTEINALYDVNYHNVSWVTDGDALTGDYTNGSTAYGTPIVAPNTPTKTGYTFNSWSPSVDETMPDNDVTYTATWDINSYTITIINSDERGGQVVLTEDYGTQLTFNNVEDIEIPGVTSDPLGRYFVGFKSSPTAEEVPIKTITFDNNKTYYACYTFYDANYYQYSFDGVNYVPFTSHNDCEGGELQAYNVTIPSVTAGDQLYVKYNGNVIALSSDGNSNLNTANKVNNSAENVTLNLFLIYDNGNYIYKPVLSGMPQDQFCVSVNGVLTPLTYDGNNQQVTTALRIEEGQVVDAYFNQYYACSLNSAVKEEYFKIVDGHVVCQKSGVYDVYLQNTGDNQYNRFYIGLNPEYEANLFAQEFLSKVSGECKIEKDAEGHDIVKTDKEKLAAAWSEMAGKYSSLSDGAKSALKTAKADPESTADLEKFASSYDYIYWKYGNMLKSYGGNFIERNVTPQSASRLLSVNNVSTSTWIIAAVAIVGIAAVGVFFIYRKRKEN